MMWFTIWLTAFLTAFSISVFASPIVETGDLRKRACTHSANARSCWGNYDINTDYYNTWPRTGKTVEVGKFISAFGYLSDSSIVYVPHHESDDGP